MSDQTGAALKQEIDEKRLADKRYKHLLRYDRRVLYLVMVLSLATMLLHRHALVMPLRSGETVLALLLGAVLGVSYCFRLHRLHVISGRDNSASWLIYPPLLAIVVLAYLRSFVAEAAFIGETEIGQKIPFEVTSKRVSRYFGTVASVRGQPDGREIEVYVSDALYEQLEPALHSGRDCIIINVEGGWRGIRRAVVPNVLDDPFRMSDYRRCNSH